MKRHLTGRSAPIRLILLLVIIALAVACGKGGGNVLTPLPGIQDSSPGIKGSGRPVLVLATDDFSGLEAGDDFLVTVRVRNVEDLYQFVSRLEFDPSLVAPLSVKEGGFLPEDSLFVGAAREEGTIPLAGTLIYEGRGLDGDGTLAEISFTKLADSHTGQSPVRFTTKDGYLTLIDSAKNPIDFSLEKEASR